MNGLPSQCAVTGASGYVGNCLNFHIRNAGWRTVAWTRRPAATAQVNFQLGQDIAADQFLGSHALVHCAYDFQARTWSEIVASNIRGSEKLFRAARQAQVERIVFISSVSSFPGCRSLYGRAKLEIENLAAAYGAVIIRPGLVYGNRPGGVFGGLVRQVKQSRVIPLLGRGRQLQYLVHDEDLGRLVVRAITGEIKPEAPITLAAEKPLPLRDLLTQLARALNKRVAFVPLPWQCVWLGLKALEISRLPAPFRSDSLLGLVYQNPAPSFAPARALQAHCRPFAVAPEMLK